MEYLSEKAAENTAASKELRELCDEAVKKSTQLEDINQMKMDNTDAPDRAAGNYEMILLSNKDTEIKDLEIMQLCKVKRRSWK
jgi:hypothetical protein